MITHFVIDLETCGAKSRRSAITAVSCVPICFDHLLDYNQYVRTGFFRKVNWVRQLETKTHIAEDSTMGWWASQDDAAKQHSITPLATDTLLRDALSDMRAFMVTFPGYDYDNSWFWSRGTMFDFPKLEYSFDAVGVDNPINGFRVRDIRTMIDCLTGSTNGQYNLCGTPQGFVKHHALHDAAMDAYRMADIYRRLS